jgi:hypothetical protein
MRKKALIVIIVASAVVVALASLKIYSIHDAAGGTLFWNKEEAILFLDVVNRGHRSTYLRLLVEIPEEILGGVLSTDDQRSSAIVLRFTPDAVQRYTKEDIHLGDYQFVQGNIYSRDDDGVLWKWAGMHFEQANSQEQRSLEEQQRNFRLPEHLSGPEFDAVNGWSARYALLNRTPEARFPMKVGNQTLTLAVRKTPNDFSIDFVGPSGASETVWSLGRRARKVSRSESEHTFQKR